MDIPTSSVAVDTQRVVHKQRNQSSILTGERRTQLAIECEKALGIGLAKNGQIAMFAELGSLWESCTRRE